MVAAYRLQLGPTLDLDGVRELVPYLESLGASHVYLSPVMLARADSTHGYDVVDPRLVSPALGGEEALAVPNHMAVDDANPFGADPAMRETFFDNDRVTGCHRRLYDVDHLAGVRVEDPGVFATTHATPARLIDEGVRRVERSGGGLDLDDAVAGILGGLPVALLEGVAPG